MFFWAGYACSHLRMPRAHQAGFSRRSLAGVGLSESVRCHGPGLALLTNGGVQQQQHAIYCLLLKISGVDLRLDEGTIHLQTSMSSPGFEPSPNGTAVSIANHYTGWATI
ncbi:hypothetical protein TNCV_3955261 [Trichonephila clavipes]|nr:hypothetical protein TNCV_3955261 [Trichonephila clavipes]